MKKFILILVVTAFSASGFSQTTPWISAGAIWHYKWSGIGAGGYDKIEYTHDTVILGKTCEELKTTSYTYSGPPLALISTAIWKNYTYCSADTVFYLAAGAFEVLYNFGALTGQSWDLGIDTNYFYCSRSVVKVDSTSSIIIASNPHRRLYISDSANSSAGFTGSIIEHIGSMEYLFPRSRNCGSGVVDFNVYSFSCFSDSLENFLAVAPDECANPFHVGISETNPEEQLEIYPNPANGLVTVSWSNSGMSSLSVFNTLGEELLLLKVHSDKSEVLNISELRPGMYFIHLKTKDGQVTVGRFVKK